MWWVCFLLLLAYLYWRSLPSSLFWNGLFIHIYDISILLDHVYWSSLSFWSISIRISTLFVSSISSKKLRFFTLLSNWGAGYDVSWYCYGSFHSNCYCNTLFSCSNWTIFALYCTTPEAFLYLISIILAFLIASSKLSDANLYSIIEIFGSSPDIKSARILLASIICLSSTFLQLAWNSLV